MINHMIYRLISRMISHVISHVINHLKNHVTYTILFPQWIANTLSLKKTIYKISDLTDNRTHILWVTVQARYPLRYHPIERLWSF